MATFRRRRRAADAVVADARRFWSWWSGMRHTVTSACAMGDRARVEALVGPRVRHYHPELTWHVGAGTHARLMLVVSGARRGELRSVCERWRMAGPADDETWEYHAALPPEPSAFAEPLRVADRELDPAAAVTLAAPDDRRYRLDLSVHHPAFGELDEGERVRVATVLVEWALGEDEIDRWIGRVTTTELRPLDAVPVPMLGTVTAQLRERWGGERWARLEGSFGARTLVASVRHPLHRVDHPLLDEHIAVRLPYAAAGPDGLPTDRALAELEAIEAVLRDRLRADALLVAHQTASGERLLHFYADSAARRAYAIRGLLSRSFGPLATVQAEYDPGWRRIDHLRV